MTSLDICRRYSAIGPEMKPTNKRAFVFIAVGVTLFIAAVQIYVRLYP